MKTTVIWLVTMMAIVSLLSFQALILFDSYQSKKKEIELNINTLMHESVKNEVMIRREKSDLKEGASVIDNNTFKENPKFHSHEIFDLNEKEMIEAGIYQQLVHNYGYPFNILTLDSIFQSELQTANLSYCYVLYFRDSTGLVIEQTNDLSPKQLKKAFQTDSLLIIHGNRVQAFVVISPPSVYKQIAGLLISSCMVVFFLFFCIGYLIKNIFTQLKLNQLKNDFINSFTHNLKSPIGTIKTVLTKFITGGFDNFPVIKEKHGKVGIAQVDNLLMQTEQILTVAKLEEGQLGLNRSHSDMNEMIQELKDKFSVSNEKFISIHTSVSIGNDVNILIDRTLIQEAISNLIDNSIKYSGDSVEIIVDCDIVGKTLQIRVKDNGYGISEKDQRTIFEKFERGAAVKRKEAKGFGLGLNFVRRVVEAHGGFVKLYSHLGEGSEFSLLLPIPSA